jgi:hypothetical protein
MSDVMRVRTDGATGGQNAQPSNASSMGAHTPNTTGPVECCDICDSETVVWRKCKQICLTCGTILKSCADL